jgi:hypothetical protein
MVQQRNIERRLACIPFGVAFGLPPLRQIVPSGRRLQPHVILISIQNQLQHVLCLPATDCDE